MLMDKLSTLILTADFFTRKIFRWQAAFKSDFWILDIGQLVRMGSPATLRRFLQCDFSSPGLSPDKHDQASGANQGKEVQKICHQHQTHADHGLGEEVGQDQGNSQYS